MIDRLANPQIQEQIESSKAFLRTLWQCENTRRPGFLIGYTGPRLRGGTPVTSAIFSTEGTDTVRDRLLDPKKFLDAQLAEINGQLAFQGDFVPALTPTLGVVTIPSAFGGEVIWPERDFPSVRPCLNDPEQIADLKLPDLRAGVLGRILDYTRYFRQAAGGRLPIRLTDIQGPLDNASLMMGHNAFLLAIRTHPDLVHHLLQMITDLTIQLVQEQRRLAEDFVPSLMQPWLPDGGGISISNDDSVMISSRHMAEFAVPYFNQLSDAFGGIFIHSCGNWSHQFPALDQVRSLRGLEFGASETPFGPVLDHFGGKIVLACRIGLQKEYKFAGMVARSWQPARQTAACLSTRMSPTGSWMRIGRRPIWMKFTG
jgi:hypothetical protein